MKKLYLLWAFLALGVLVALVAIDPPRTRKPAAPPEVEPAPESTPPRPARTGKRARSKYEKPATTAAAQEPLIKEALDAAEPPDERALALDLLEAAVLEQEQVDRLASLATSRNLDPEVRKAAFDALLAVAIEGSEPARLKALEIFASEPASPAEEPGLAQLLADQDPEVRRGAANALGEASEQEEALLALERAFPLETDEMVQEAIAAAIVRAPHARAAASLQRLAGIVSPSQAQILAHHQLPLVQNAPLEATPSPGPESPREGAAREEK